MNNKSTIEFLTETVADRIEEMVKDPQIQKIMMTFKNNDDAKTWVTKAAIATLIGK